MKRIISLAVVAVIGFLSCKKPSHNNNGYEAHAAFYDEEGGEIKEASSGTVLFVRSKELDQFLLGQGQNNNQAAPLPSPNNVQVMFDNTIAQVVAVEQGKVAIAVPVMNLMDYKFISISFIYKNVRLHLIEKLMYRPTVTATPFAGSVSGEPDGTFNLPAEMVADGSGNLYVIDQHTDGHDRIIHVTPSGASSVFAGAGGSFGRLVGIGFSPSFGQLYVADATAQQIKSINLSTAAITVLAGSGVAGNADGTGLAATFRFGQQAVNNFSTNEMGQGLTVDAAGNIYVAENASTAFGGLTSDLRKITPSGVVTTVPGSVITSLSGPTDGMPPSGLTLNDLGELVYICGANTRFQGLVRLTGGATPALVRFAGHVTTTEGLNDGVGAAAMFSYPKATQFKEGYYWVADGTNGALRRVTTSGEVMTVAGVGHFSTPTWLPCSTCRPATASYVLPSFFNTDPNRYELAAAAIKMNQVGGVAVQASGVIYVSDYGTNFQCIWKITIA